ncbi:choice-of-anchor Q domain-containing protein [Wenzhouxiangella sediminis]|uniref:Right-handed parallel beta-helix repeat-containing protein n=1 Tax=Wenzhouxiangella sediminis TaxID=1792836 RepID=A0A3E1K9M4_9GAMM|nr:choice-of-anchor Q domain-containing protein [Wenzhouxiangella sediminis]RFF30864.1 hypothetical protein DZC52_06370 [Wenzhouxiangella sediminis]
MQNPRSQAFRPGALATAIGFALAASGAQAATFQVTSTANSGPGTLRQAIQSANGQVGPHIIDLSGVSGQTITLTGGLPFIAEDMTLQGSEVTLSGDDQYRCLSAEYANLEVSDMTITRCAGTTVGGEVRGGQGPYSYQAGGGIFAYGGDVSLSNVTISDNTAYGSGGGKGPSYGYGGGVAVIYGSLSVTNGSIITGNGSAYGGGIAHSGPQLLVQGSEISDNQSYAGGGVINRPPQRIGRGDVAYGMFFENAVISGNSAAEGGGLNVIGPLSLIDTEISNNDAAYVAGGVFARSLSGPNRGVSSEIVVSGSAIVNNSAGYEAGGGWMDAKYGMVMENTTVSGNTAQAVGGLYTIEGPNGNPVVFNGVTITGNSATDGPVGGMAVYSTAQYSQVDISNSIIAGNSATEGDVDLAGSIGPQPEGNTQAAGGKTGEAGWKPRVSSRLPGRTAWTADFSPKASKAGLEGWDRGQQPPGPPGPATFEVSYSLVGAVPSTGTFNADAVSSGLVGANPLLGPLGNNGGPTPSHLPAANGPGIDLVPQGTNGCGTSFAVDQRGEARPDASSGQCDLGSVEIQGTPPPPGPAPLAVPVNNPVALALLALGAGLLGFFGLGRGRRRA